MTLDELETLSRAVIGRAENRELRAQWDAGIAASNLDTLVPLSGRILISDNHTDRTGALRDQVRSEIDRRLVDKQLAAAKKLECAASFVGWVGVVLAVLGVFVGIPSAVVDLKELGWWPAW